MGYDFELSGETSLVHPVYDGCGGSLSIDGHSFRAALTGGLADGEYTLDVNGRREQIFLASQADTHYIHWRGRAYRVDSINALERARRAAEPSGGAEILRAPMPGTVIEIIATEGSDVAPGALLLTIESMKLQTAITAPDAAQVAEIYVSAGATFDQGDALVRLEEPREPEGPDGSDEGGLESQGEAR